MNNIFYVLISRDELVNIVKTGNIILPSFSRIVSPFDENIDAIESHITEKLGALNVNSSEDYVLSLVEVKNIRIEVEFNLSIFDLKKLYCFDDISLSAYRRNFSQFCFNLIELDLDIEDVVESSNKKRLYKILEDELGILINSPVSEQSEQVENYFTKNEKVKTLINFKREASLIEGNKSLLNDTVTLAMINSNREQVNTDNQYKKYIAGTNIAGGLVDKFIKANPAMHNIDSNSFSVFINTVIEVIQNDKHNESSLITRLNNLELIGKFDYLIFKLIYLKLKNVFRESDDFNSIISLHNELKSIAENELNVAYIIFFSKLEYSDLYTSYYEYKKLSLSNNYVPPQSDENKKIESLKIQLKSREEEFKALLEENSTLKSKVSNLTCELGETKSKLSETISENIKEKSSFEDKSFWGNDESEGTASEIHQRLNELLEEKCCLENKLQHVAHELEETKYDLKNTSEELLKFKDDIPTHATQGDFEKNALEYLFFELFSDKDINKQNLPVVKVLYENFDLGPKGLALPDMKNKLVEFRNTHNKVTPQSEPAILELDMEDCNDR